MFKTNLHIKFIKLFLEFIGSIVLKYIIKKLTWKICSSSFSSLLANFSKKFI